MPVTAWKKARKILIHVKIGYICAGLIHIIHSKQTGDTMKKYYLMLMSAAIFGFMACGDGGHEGSEGGEGAQEEQHDESSAVDQAGDMMNNEENAQATDATEEQAAPAENASENAGMEESEGDGMDASGESTEG